MRTVGLRGSDITVIMSIRPQLLPAALNRARKSLVFKVFLNG